MRSANAEADSTPRSGARAGPLIPLPSRSALNLQGEGGLLQIGDVHQFAGAGLFHVLQERFEKSGSETAVLPEHGRGRSAQGQTEGQLGVAVASLRRQIQAGQIKTG